MIDLSVGSPVDPVPDSVRKALAISSNDPNAYGYPVTAGTADLRDAIHEWFAAARNVDLRAIGADVVPTVGSKEGVALMASLLHFGEGDVVVQPKVSYPTYEIGTQLAGAQTLKVDDVADADSWKDVPGARPFGSIRRAIRPVRCCPRNGWPVLCVPRARLVRGAVR